MTATSLHLPIELAELRAILKNHGVDIATKLHPRFEPYITPDLVEIL